MINWHFQSAKLLIIFPGLVKVSIYIYNGSNFAHVTICRKQSLSGVDQTRILEERRLCSFVAKADGIQMEAIEQKPNNSLVCFMVWAMTPDLPAAIVVTLHSFATLFLFVWFVKIFRPGINDTPVMLHWLHFLVFSLSVALVGFYLRFSFLPRMWEQFWKKIKLKRK